MNILNQGFDHVEFYVGQIEPHETMWQKLGFERIGTAEYPALGKRSAVWAQGRVRVVLTQFNATGAQQPGAMFHNAHGDGIGVIAVEVDDAAAAYQETVSRGAISALAPVTKTTLAGAVTVAEIFTPSDLRYRFVSRQGTAFVPGLAVARLESPSPTGLVQIDHLTNNINMGEFDTWVSYYKRVFDFVVARTFNIKTGKTGLKSDVVQSRCGRIKVPINEATEKESQVQEFCDRFKGAGVQHLAFLTKDLVNGLQQYRAQGFKFLSVPSTYYDVVPTRVPGVTEDLKLLEKLGILLDGEGGGYLMQIFTAELIGPFFCEFIQRKGNNGFGEGNFRALFEAIERDQVQRGVLA